VTYYFFLLRLLADFPLVFDALLLPVLFLVVERLFLVEDDLVVLLAPAVFAGGASSIKGICFPLLNDSLSPIISGRSVKRTAPITRLRTPTFKTERGLMERLP
jgi:hypothetical protein